MTSEMLENAIMQAASFYNIPADLIRSIVMTESSGDIYAYRVEPHYRYLWNVDTGAPFRRLSDEENRSERAPMDFPFIPVVSNRNTEWLGQQASWGPMQVMGAVAREYGYERAFPRLCGRDGVMIGTKHLGVLKKRYYDQHGWPGVIAAYNAGSPRYIGDSNTFVNQKYVNNVLKNSKEGI